MQNSTVQSPAFGYLSPPIDGCDAMSEDGDTLQTPLTDHPEHHQPYAMYQQNRGFAHGLFKPDSPAVQSQDKSPKPAADHQECTPYKDLMTPHASERLGPTVSAVDSYYNSFTCPAPALDLANASLEYDPFAASFASAYEASTLFAPSAQPYNQSDDPFKFLSPDLEYSQDESPPNSSTGPTQGQLSTLPSLSLSVSVDSLDSHESNDSLPSLLLAPSNSPSLNHPRPGLRTAASENVMMTKARLFNPRFPADHELNPFFARTYLLGDELGAGGYGFVMTARHRIEGYEVAIKFIVKHKVPNHAWWNDELLGMVPTEVMIMSLLNHDNIVRCLDLFEDELYFYLIQELHGTPWISRKKRHEKQITAPGKLLAASPSMSTPSLTPSPSTELIDSPPVTPPQVEISVEQIDATPETAPKASRLLPESQDSDSQFNISTVFLQPTHSIATHEEHPVINTIPSSVSESPSLPGGSQGFLEPPDGAGARPNFSRRPSYDLFECIEQSKHKRLSENNARYIFAQVVEAVHYLDSQGITHCDIKDENLVVDAEFKVKLIDFGSAVVADPNGPRPYYELFFGTTAYASSEILRKQPYQAAPAEIWTLGVLLSYLLTGHSPFPTEQDAVDGRMVIRERGGTSKLSRAALSLMARCLERDPERRADIAEVRGHRWLIGALDRDREYDGDERV